MFWFRESVGRVELAFTDRQGGVSEGPYGALNLGSAGGDDRSRVVQNHALVAEALGVEGLHSMSQVHGRDVVLADVLRVDGSGTVPQCDGLVTTSAGMALLVRVADCVPVVLADPATGVVGAAHAGRVGMVEGVVAATVDRMRAEGARDVEAWIGPRACGRCYELPEEMVAAVESVVPGTRSVTSWGTPAVDVGAGVVSQLEALGVGVHDVGADTCTIEDERFFSYRRQGTASGRFGGVVVAR